MTDPRPFPPTDLQVLNPAFAAALERDMNFYNATRLHEDLGADAVAYRNLRGAVDGIIRAMSRNTGLIAAEIIKSPEGWRRTMNLVLRLADRQPDSAIVLELKADAIRVNALLCQNAIGRIERRKRLKRDRRAKRSFGIASESIIGDQFDLSLRIMCAAAHKLINAMRAAHERARPPHAPRLDGMVCRALSAINMAYTCRTDDLWRTAGNTPQAPITPMQALHWLKSHPEAYVELMKYDGLISAFTLAHFMAHTPFNNSHTQYRFLYSIATLACFTRYDDEVVRLSPRIDAMAASLGVPRPAWLTAHAAYLSAA